MAEKLIPMLCIGRRMYVQFLGVIFFCIIGLLSAEEVCKFTYKGQPEDLHDSTIVVNEKMVAMSEYIYVGTPKGSTPVQLTTPTIFFIIDHSSSMSSSNNPNDQWGNRFTVTRDLIDTLRMKFPKAEVGISVFKRYLFFDPADDDLFAQCPQHDTGAYIPLLKLDSSYVPSGKMGWQILKEYLDTTLVSSPNQYVDLKYQPSDPTLAQTRTHINAGFDAAKHAMLSSMFEKECHYIIFLSDGDATWPQDGTQEDFVEGTDVPTTFTIYFTDNNTTPPSLQQMTTNIQGNGYSTSNPESDLWAFENNNYDSLMNFIMKNVISVINQTQISYPTDIVINGIDPVGSWDSTGFTFADLFPLEGETTPFVFDIDYHIFVDSITEDGLDTIVVEKDTSTHIEFEVVIEDGAPDLPDTFKVECWGRNLEFYYNGNAVSSVNETMEDIEIRFSEYQVDWLYGYTGVKVEITHTAGSTKDKENYTLENKGSYWAYTFPREIDSTPDVGDGTLQHHAIDSIVAVFRNPKLPLDTLRVTVPFILSGVTAVECAYYFDRNAEGHIDSIYVKVDGDLTDDMVKEIMDSDLLTLPSFRGFTITDFQRVTGGIALIVEQDPSNDPITYVTDEDSLVIKETILNQGGWLMGGIVPIFDKVSPIIVYKSLNYAGETHRSPFVIDYQIADSTDTLFVAFSEKITLDEDATEPFYFLDTPQNEIYAATIQSGGFEFIDDKTVKFALDQVSSDDGSIRAGDSIWIHESDRIGDICESDDGGTGNNYQNNPDNRRREVGVVFKTIVIDFIPISISPLNLSDINNESITIPDEIIQLFIDSNALDNLSLQINDNGDFIGMVIQIIPDLTNIDSLSLKTLFLEGKISIFDAVGNRIISRKQMLFNSANKTLNYIWHGRNSRDRFVSASSYLAMSEITKWPLGKGDNKPSKRFIKKLMIAVKE